MYKSFTVYPLFWTPPLFWPWSTLFQRPLLFISSEMLMSESATGILMTFPFAIGTSIPLAVYLQRVGSLSPLPDKSC